MRTPSTINEERLARVLEDICQQGCNRVEVIIEALQNGKVPEVAIGLNEGETAKLLCELTEVMLPLKNKE